MGARERPGDVCDPCGTCATTGATRSMLNATDMKSPLIFMTFSLLAAPEPLAMSPPGRTDEGVRR